MQTSYQPIIKVVDQTPYNPGYPLRAYEFGTHPYMGQFEASQIICSNLNLQYIWVMKCFPNDLIIFFNTINPPLMLPLNSMDI